MKTLVFFPYETKNREFDGRLLLASFLLERGMTIYIGSRNAMKTEALSHTKGIFFLKSLSNEESGFYEKLRERGHKIVLLHAEGGIHYKKNEENILSAFKPALLAYVDRNYVFGISIKSSIEQLASFKNNVVTGEPRFDLLKPKYHSFFNDDIKRIRNKYRTYVLINTNFGLANSFVGEEKLIKYYETESTMTNESKRLLLHKLEYQKRIFTTYLEAIKQIAKAFKNTNIVIRPHPSESEVEYLKISDIFSNVHVNKDGNVTQWILGAKAVIHYDCTTGMEAALAKIPVISFLPEKDESILAWLPVSLSIEINNIGQLIENINLILNGEKTENRLSSNTYNEWKDFVNNVEFEASNLIADDLLVISQENNSQIKKLAVNAQVFNRLHRIKRDLKDLKIKLTKRKSITKSKFGFTNKNEILLKINVFKQINNFGYKTKVVRLSHDAYIIKRK